MPRCSPSTNYTVTVEPVTGDCDKWIDVSMKEGPAKVPSQPLSHQNYPNPLTAFGGFKTTIPFVTDQVGTATISVTNEAGQQILEESMEATFAGQHFFYFTGDRLPSGKYFYEIQFPQGNVIVERTMIVVK